MDKASLDPEATFLIGNQLVGLAGFESTCRPH
jgi:hypothetical protein